MTQEKSNPDAGKGHSEGQPTTNALALKIGVMGGAGEGIPEAHLRKAFILGEEIARNECITITGACLGLPLQAALGSANLGGMVIGISPALSLDEHCYHYQSPTIGHDMLIFTGSGLMGREVVNIRSSDIVTIVGGSSGTLGELAIAYDEGKLIGVLTGTGGISDMVEEILRKCNKQTGARVVYDDDPRRLVKSLLQIYRNEHFRRPSVFCRQSDGQKQKPSESATKDPVCGMMVEPGNGAARRTRGGREFMFCSLNCTARFDIQPDRYVAANDRIG